MVLKELSKISDVTVDISKLLEKGEEIRLKARDLMKRTQQEMNRMQKSQEYDPIIRLGERFMSEKRKNVQIWIYSTNI